jgi:hypothetical protein
MGDAGTVPKKQKLKSDLTSSAPSRKSQDELSERLVTHIESPVECFLDTFWDFLVENEKQTGVEPESYLDGWQKEVLAAFAEHNYVAVTGGNSVGKSTVAAVVIWTYQKTRPNAVGQATSIDSIQLSHVLWAELRRWYDRGPELQKAFEFRDHSFYHRQHKKTWWMLARTARRQHDINLKDGGEHSTGLQGIHAPHVLMVIDEGSGVEDPNWEAAESSIREPDNRLFAISNPLRVSGRMFQIFNLENFRKYWYTRQVSYKECPRIDKKIAEDQIAMLGGEDSPVVQIRFLGQFPKRGADDTLPSYDGVKRAMVRSRAADVEAIDIILRLVDGEVPVECYYSYEVLQDYKEKFSYERETDFLPEYLYSAKVNMPKPPKRWLDMVADYFAGPCRLGIDLARYGSAETVFAVRRGWRIVELRPRYHIDTIQILATIRELFGFYPGMDLVIVDKTGLLGDAVCDMLKLEKIPSIAVGFGEAAIVSEDFRNQATEMWFEVANNIERISLPYDLQLLTQFTTRKYGFTGKALQKAIEDKESMKRRKLPSPDRADSVCLAVKRVQIISDDLVDDYSNEVGGSFIDDESFIDES